MIAQVHKKREGSKYQIRLKINDDIRSRCEITYLIDNNNERKFILLPNSQGYINYILKLCPKEVKEEYKLMLSIFDEKDYGRVSKAKSIVNSIFNEQHPFNNTKYIGIGIHKFGYVPVIKLPAKIVDENSEQVDYQMGFYPFNRREHSKPNKSTKYPFGINNNDAFIESLAIEPQILFKKYLDDVGELFNLIQYNSDKNQVFIYSKKIHDILGESVKSKLETVFPEYRNPHKAKKIKTTQNLTRDKLRKDINYFIPRFARSYALYLLNELYFYINKASRDDYKNELKIYIRELHNEYANALNDLEFLTNLFYKYNNNKLIYEEEIINNLEADDWKYDFAQFVSFLSFLKSLKRKPSKTKIIISKNNCLEAQILQEQIHHLNKDNAIDLIIDSNSLANYPQKHFNAKIWFGDHYYALLLSFDQLKDDLRETFSYEIYSTYNYNKSIDFFISDFDIKDKIFREILNDIQKLTDKRFDATKLNKIEKIEYVTKFQDIKDVSTSLINKIRSNIEYLPLIKIKRKIIASLQSFKYSNEYYSNKTYTPIEIINIINTISSPNNPVTVEYIVNYISTENLSLIAKESVKKRIIKLIENSIAKHPLSIDGIDFPLITRGKKEGRTITYYGNYKNIIKYFVNKIDEKRIKKTISEIIEESELIYDELYY